MAHQTYEELEAILDAARQAVPVDATYIHSATHGAYRVTDHVIREASDEAEVIYESLDHPRVKFSRSVLSWLEDVEIDGAMVPRYQRWM